ncbi:hypothetical protein QJQ45_027002 [Haematococcus lacustris]|nr:hypothetical protein QJQ45_027002 [Haematococcus lacustris]
MNNSEGHSDAHVSGVAVEAPSAEDEVVPATTLLELPAALLDDIALRLVKGRETLACICFGLFEAGLLHAPSFRLQLNRQCCDQLLSPRVIAGLRARMCKLAITLEQPRVQGSRLLAEVLGKLGICTAVEACKLSSLQGPSLAPRTPLDCSPSLAQCLVDSFPSLTSLALHGYSIPCRGLATLLAHPQLSLQLQQLDLTGTNILQQLEGVAWGLDTFIAALAPLTQLQVLTMPGCRHLGGLPGLLQALPQLHTLQLPDAAPEGQMQLDALLAATQLTSIKLNSLEGLTSSCADVPCSWQRLELTGCVDCATAAYLPLHSLTQPLVVGSLEITADYRSSGGSPLVAAAAHNLTQACQVPVRIKVWRLYMCAMPNIPAFLARQRVQMQQLVVLLQPLRHCTPEQVSIYHLIDVSAADVPALALLCQGCTHLEFLCGSLVPSLEFWGQLVQLMPTVTFVVFKHVEGSTSSAMFTSLLDLPPPLMDDIASRATLLDAGEALSVTCRAFSKTNLLHAPALHIQLDSQRCDQFLTPRVVAALQARTCKLVLTLEQQRAQSSRQYTRLLTEVLKKLASCVAVEACKLGTAQGPSLHPHKPLGCSPDLAQHLMVSFPSLTSLSLHNCAIPCSGLSSLLSHPRLSLQLQQLDLSSTNILQAKWPEPGAPTLATLFHASRLKQLSLLIDNRAEGENKPLLPNLQPLSQHLTQLCIQQREGVVWGLDEFTAALQPLAQLQVLTISSLYHLQGLAGLLQALPQLHTLQLPHAAIRGEEQLDILLAATQLTSIQLSSSQDLGSSRADVPCSWKRLELTGYVDCSSAAYLPLHTLTQPLVVGELFISTDEDDDCDLVAAAVHNLTQACKVPVRIEVLRLSMFVMPDSPAMAAQQQEDLKQLVAALQALKHCNWGMVSVTHMDMGAADVATLAPLCQGCTRLEFSDGSLTPSLEFWHQLVQHMPTVTHLTFTDADGSASAAMCESLQLMTQQPWARWLDICISRPSGSYRSSSSHMCFAYGFIGQQTVPAMSQRGMQHQVTVDGSASATDGYSPASEAPPPVTRLLDLPPALLDDIACRVMQLGARSLLPLTSRAFSQAHLRHYPHAAQPPRQTNMAPHSPSKPGVAAEAEGGGVGSQAMAGSALRHGAMASSSVGPENTRGVVLLIGAPGVGKTCLGKAMVAQQAAKGANGGAPLFFSVGEKLRDDGMLAKQVAPDERAAWAETLRATARELLKRQLHALGQRVLVMEAVEDREGADDLAELLDQHRVPLLQVLYLPHDVSSAVSTWHYEDSSQHDAWHLVLDRQAKWQRAAGWLLELYSSLGCLAEVSLLDTKGGATQQPSLAALGYAAPAPACSWLEAAGWAPLGRWKKSSDSSSINSSSAWSKKTRSSMPQTWPGLAITLLQPVTSCRLVSCSRARAAVVAEAEAFTGLHPLPLPVPSRSVTCSADARWLAYPGRYLAALKADGVRHLLITTATGQPFLLNRAGALACNVAALPPAAPPPCGLPCRTVLDGELVLHGGGAQPLFLVFDALCVGGSPVWQLPLTARLQHLDTLGLTTASEAVIGQAAASVFTPRPALQVSLAATAATSPAATAAAPPHGFVKQQQGPPRGQDTVLVLRKPCFPVSPSGLLQLEAAAERCGFPADGVVFSPCAMSSVLGQAELLLKWQPPGRVGVDVLGSHARSLPQPSWKSSYRFGHRKLDLQSEAPGPLVCEYMRRHVQVEVSRKRGIQRPGQQQVPVPQPPTTTLLEGNAWIMRSVRFDKTVGNGQAVKQTCLPWSALVGAVQQQQQQTAAPLFTLHLPTLQSNQVPPNPYLVHATPPSPHPARLLPFPQLYALALAAVQCGSVEVSNDPDTGLQVFNYLAAASPGSSQAAQLCRGLVLHPDSQTLVATPFTRFAVERRLASSHALSAAATALAPPPPAGQPSSPAAAAVRAAVKVDGSLVIAFLWQGQVHACTRHCMTSEQAVWAQGQLRANPAFVAHAQPGWTYLFEAVYAANTHVISYPFQGLVLLDAICPAGLGLASGAGKHALAARLGTLASPELQLRKAKELIRWLQAGQASSSPSPSTPLHTPYHPSASEGWVVTLGSSGQRAKLVHDSFKHAHYEAQLLHPLCVWDRVRQGARRDQLLPPWLPNHLRCEAEAVLAALNCRFQEVRLQHRSKEQAVAAQEHGGREQQPLGMYYSKEQALLPEVVATPHLRAQLLDLVRPAHDGSGLPGYQPSPAMAQTFAKAWPKGPLAGRLVPGPEPACTAIQTPQFFELVLAALDGFSALRVKSVCWTWCRLVRGWPGLVAAVEQSKETSANNYGSTDFDDTKHPWEYDYSGSDDDADDDNDDDDDADYLHGMGIHVEGRNAVDAGFPRIFFHIEVSAGWRGAAAQHDYPMVTLFWCCDNLRREQLIAALPAQLDAQGWDVQQVGLGEGAASQGQQAPGPKLHDPAGDVIQQRWRETNLLHAPALHIQLDSQRCDQFLTPRVVAALQARTCKLVLTLEQQRAQSSRQYIRLLTEVLKKLASCVAVEACKLGTAQGPSLHPHKPLGCSPDLAQHLMDSFPSLTSLSLHNCATPCSGLSSLLSHPRLSLQLQQLDISSTNILQAKWPEPGAATLATLFHASRLKQLSLLINNMAEGENKPLLPNLQPLSQHLTQLRIQQREGVVWGLDEFTAALQPLAQLQVLTLPDIHNLKGLSRLLQALPQLHTLQLPDAVVNVPAMASQQPEELQQLVTELQVLKHCSWERVISYDPQDDVTSAITVSIAGSRNYKHVAPDGKALASGSQSTIISVPTRIKALRLSMFVFPDVPAMASQQPEELQQLVTELQVLKHCSWERVISYDPQDDVTSAITVSIAGSRNYKHVAPDGKALASGSQSTIISGVAVEAPSAEDELVPATTLLDLPAALLDDIALRSVRGRETLARTCFGLFEAGLLHAPSFRLQLNRQCCDQLPSPRVIAGLRARTCKLAITLEQPRVQGSRLLAEVLGKLGICTAVEACKLSSLQGPSLAPRTPLDCSPSLAQCLVDSFPALTSLALHGYSIPCSGLATLLAHPQLSLQLQQLDLTGTTILQQLEGALPQLHTLQLLDAAPEGQMQLDALLAATQLTSIKLNSLEGLTSSCADVPCSWQRLELTGCVDCATAAYLPLHSLTQPLVVGSLEITADYRSSGGSPLVAAAAHNLTQACQVPVRIKVWRLYMCAMPNIPAFLARQRVQMQQLVVLLQPLRHCTPEQVSIYHLIDVSAADVPALALLCQGCTHLEFLCGSLVPSLEFWGQLVQLMPTVTFVVFKHVEGSTSSAMRDSLELMTEQPWARWHSDVTVDGVAVEAPSATLETLPGTPLLDLPPPLMDDIASRATLLDAGEALSVTCRAFSKTNLLHAPALRIQLDSQRCDQFLTPRVVAALQARTCKLVLTLEQQPAQSSRQYTRLLTEVLKKLASCVAVEACKLGTAQGPSLHPHKPLGCSPDLAQHLMVSFPSLTSLSLHNCATPCSGLSSLLSHPRLSLQLQQLDISSTNILQAKRPEPGAATLATLFHASRLKQLSLLIDNRAEGENKPLLPNLQPLSQHLTQLCLQQREGVVWGLDEFTAALQPLAQLQVLTISSLYHLQGLAGLLQALPQLHTLQLPHAAIRGEEQLDILLAATQLTSIQLSSSQDLGSSRADVPCSWKRLELTGYVDCSSAAHLPLRSLTHPLVLGELFISPDEDDDCNLVAAAVHNLTQACSVPVRIEVLRLSMFVMPDSPAMAAQQQVELQQLVAALQALKHCNWGIVTVTHMDMGAADVATLAPLCQGCTQLVFSDGSVTPSLEFWHQLVQHMPTVTHLTFTDADGSASAAMCSESIAGSESIAEIRELRAARSSQEQPALLDDIACRVMQLGARSLLPLTCRAFSQAHLLHVPALSIQLCRPRCDQQLTPQVVAALQARKSKLTLTLWQPKKGGSAAYKEQLAPTLQLPQAEYTQVYTDLLAHALAKLDNCAAVEVCKLVRSLENNPDERNHIRCSPGLAQRLLDSFPSLTALTLQGFAVSSDALASLLSHPPLARRLQQLHLTTTYIVDLYKPGAIDAVLQGLQLKQPSIIVMDPKMPYAPPLPSFQHLAQHLTQLHLNFFSHDNDDFTFLVEYLQPLAQLQVLTLSRHYLEEGFTVLLPWPDTLEGLPELLQALPLLHTLQLPLFTVRGQQELDTLLAATQITSLQLRGVTGLDASRADVPCSWQRLQLTGAVEGPDIMYLPLHSLSQPLVLERLEISEADFSDPVVPAALHIVAEAIKVPVQVKEVQLTRLGQSQQHLNPFVRIVPTVALLQQQRADVAVLPAMLQPLQCCGKVQVNGLYEVTAADVLALAPLCRDCTHFVLDGGSMEPSLEFWRQLVQLMPAVQKVDFIRVKGCVSAAMHESLLLMAKQPWARWLDITLQNHCNAPKPPAYWRAGSWLRTGVFKVTVLGS